MQPSATGPSPATTTAKPRACERAEAARRCCEGGLLLMIGIDFVRIIELACYSVDIPPKDGTYAMSHGRVLHAFPSTVVKVTAEDGTSGFGEACTLGGNYVDGFAASARATIKELSSWVLSCDPLEPDVLVDGMDDLVIGHLPGKAAIDIAMWDLRGKLLGQPVAKLLGGVKQTSLGAFQAISLASPAEMADEVRRMADHGFRRWQLKLGDDPLDDAQRVLAVAEAMPGDSQFLSSDANRGWSVAQALRFVRAVDGIDTYVEQPCRTMEELARVRAHTSLPMMVDESAREVTDLLEASRLGCMDAINLKPVRVGGLTKAARIRDLAQAMGVMVMVDEPQGADLATAGMVQLAATVSPRSFLGVSFFTGAYMPISYRRSDAAEQGPRIDHGVATWSEDPGLGIDIDESVFGDPVFRCTTAR